MRTSWSGIKPSALPRWDPARAAIIILEHSPRPIGGTAPADLAAATRWIELNGGTIEACWNGDIAFTEDMISRIERV